MNGGILPLLLLCATVGLVLARTEWREAWIGVAALGASALLVSFAVFPSQWQEAIFVGLWLSVIATAVLTYVPRIIARRWAASAAINAGVWAGSLASISGMRSGLLPALLISLILIPGHWVGERISEMPVKVVASWMIAIACLSMFVSLVPTPGYEPDHMQ
ncbi:MAG: hypothetical protein ABIW03_04335 [Sphingomicrobium sp.]